MMRDDRIRRKQRIRRLPPEEQLRIHHIWLVVDQLEFDRKLRRKAVRLSRKAKKQSDAWVV